MKVAVNARLLGAPTLRGWNRYTINLLAHLPEQGVRPLLYCDRPPHPDHLARLPAGSFDLRVAPSMRYLRWEQQWLSYQCAADRVDLLHCPMNFGLPWSCPCPRVLTLHDAIDAAYERPRMRWGQRIRPAHVIPGLYHRVARACAERVITVSNYSRNDLVRCLGVVPDRITVIAEAADSRFSEVTAVRTERDRQKYGLVRPYVLYVGGWESRKNIGFLLKAFIEANVGGIDLFLAGGTPAQRQALLETKKAIAMGSTLHTAAWVDDQDLPALYAGALCFVYPSAYEGFGLQLCEAMAAGCPTLAARATSLPEVLGKGGETFALDHTAELSQLIGRTAADPEFRADLAQRARARSHAFSWSQTAARTVAVYREACARRAA